MLKHLLRFLLKSVVSFVLMILFVIILAAIFMGPHVKQNSMLVVDLSGPLPEQGPTSWKERLLIGDVLTTHDVIHSLEKAKDDRRIRALLVSSLYSVMGPAKAQEIRRAVQDFAATTKKPVYGYIEDGGTIDYYICSAASKLFMPPDSDTWYTLIGVRAEIPFFKGTLDKLGIVPQMDHVGQYKSGSEIWTRQDMSDKDREQTNALLDSLFQRITSDIAKDRKLTPDSVRKMVNEGPFTSAEFKSRKLVDDLLYRDELESRLKKQLGIESLNKIDIMDYHKPTFSEAFNQKADKIAILFATGTINPGDSSQNLGENIMGSSTIAQSLREIREDSSIKAVVLRIDSPGGSPSASDLIWREVKITSKTRPVIVSMADVAASGGYYIAMSGTKIFADPSTITGSIGVYGGKFYLKGLYDKIGVTKEIVKKGEHADLFSDYVPWDEDDWSIVRKHMNRTYDAFTRKAAEGRKKTVEQIRSIAEGRVWSGDQAIGIGLIDQIGGMKEAIAEAKKLAKVGEVSYAIYPSSSGGLSEMMSETSIPNQIPQGLSRMLLWARIAEKEHLLLIMPYQFFMQ